MFLPKSLAEITPEVRRGLSSGFMRLSFSQFGEDSVLWIYLKDKPPGFYVDVGAHHPYRLSNTAFLHMLHGWRGINIDMDPRAIAEFEKVRPGDINLCVGVGSKAEERQGTIFAEGAINSLSSAHVSRQPAHYAREQRMIEVRPLGEILHQYLVPGFNIGFLNVDAEGLDMEVLVSNDWNSFRPKVIAVETHGFNFDNPMATESYRYMRELKYKMVSYTIYTCIYVAE